MRRALLDRLVIDQLEAAGYELIQDGQVIRIVHTATWKIPHPWQILTGERLGRNERGLSGRVGP